MLNRRFVPILLVVATSLLLSGPAAATDPALPTLNLDPDQITVSGISSGAFMAVQFGVAHSAAVHGVAATAGGPYFCAGKDSWAGAGASKTIARCMQGDPAYPGIPIAQSDIDLMVSSTRAWASKGLIDDSANLAQQKVWMFHGYNDGVVKKPVTDALATWYGMFTTTTNLFYKDELNAGHAQITASCGDTGKSCQTCSATGGDFINSCPDAGIASSLYDASGAALQLFYGPLTRTPTAALKSKVTPFDQKPFVEKKGRTTAPVAIAMANTGYLYVPPECAAGQPCRLHVAFHGCQQAAETIGQAFVTKAGFNEWADGNRIVVLYPQAAATMTVPLTPLNPQGCWDLWGYNDFSFDMTGHYATKDGLQIAAVWRMVQRLVGEGNSFPVVTVASPTLSLVDASDNQVALTWTPVAEAHGYAVYRDSQRLPAVSQTAMVDGALAPAATYTYTVAAIAANGDEGVRSNSVQAKTAPTPPACDPYFSMILGRPVSKKNVPTTKTCP